MTLFDGNDGHLMKDTKRRIVNTRGFVRYRVGIEISTPLLWNPLEFQEMELDFEKRVKLKFEFVELGFLWDDNEFGVEFENIKWFSKCNNNDYK